jgi:hypothetical protein
MMGVAEFWLYRPSRKKFPLLKIGTQTLTNATVTTRNKDYVFILHPVA